MSNVHVKEKWSEESQGVYMIKCVPLVCPPEMYCKLVHVKEKWSEESHEVYIVKCVPPGLPSRNVL